MSVLAEKIYHASLILGSPVAYAVDKIYVTLREAAVERIHRGIPPLSKFTNCLTCSRISTGGKLVPSKCDSRYH